MDKPIPQFCARMIAINPTGFNHNSETAEDNIFQNTSPDSTEKNTKKVIFDTFFRHRKSMLSMWKI